MSLASIQARMQPPERRTVLAQTKLTPTESELLNEFVDWCKAQGFGVDASRSSVMRALILEGIANARKDMG